MLRQGEVAVDKAQLCAELPLKVLDDRVGKPAARTLEVTVLNQGERSLRGALHMIVVVYRNSKRRHGISLQRQL